MPKPDDDQKSEKTQGSGWLAGIVKLLFEVNKEPGAALLLVGLLIILAAFISQLGSLRIVARSSVVPTAAAGIALVFVGGLWHRSAAKQLEGRKYDPIVMDRGFMLAVFEEAMPPAFIKVAPKDGSIIEQPLPHVLESQALIDVQDVTDRINSSDPRYAQSDGGPSGG